MQWVLGPKDFITGLSPSEEFGSLWLDQQGIDPELIVQNSTSERFNVGVLRAGRTRTDIATGVVSALPTRVAKYTGSGASVSGTVLMFVGGLGGYRVDSGNTLGGGADAVSALTFVSGAYTDVYGGIGYLSSVSGSQFWVAMRCSAGVDRLIQLDTPLGATVTIADPGTSAFAGTNVPHPSFLKNNILWWGDGNIVAKLTTDTGLTLNVLDIPKNWIIQSINEYDKYLVLGATDGNSSYATRSRLFLWDMLSDSWNYDFPVDKAITKLVNDNSILFVYTTDGVDFSIFQFDGARVTPLNRHKVGGLASQYIPFRTDSVGILDGKQYVSIRRRDANTNVYLEAMSLGSFIDNSEILNSPALVLSGNSVAKTPGAIETGDLNKIYYCWQDTGGYAISKLASSGRADSEGTTIDLDSYFGGTGALKKLNWIRFEFNRLATGDQVDLYHHIDYVSEASSTRIDDASSAAISNSIRYSDLGTATTKTFMIGKQFRHYKLRLIFVTGSVRITKIVIDWDYIKDGQ